MSQRFLIVDGHSVIFAWPELRALHRRRTASARERLTKILTAYQDFTGIRVVLVFDGKGTTITQETDPGGIQIFYSNTGRTADDLIERLAAKYGNLLNYGSHFRSPRATNGDRFWRGMHQRGR